MIENLKTKIHGEELLGAPLDCIEPVIKVSNNCKNVFLVNSNYRKFYRSLHRRNKVRKNNHTFITKNKFSPATYCTSSCSETGLFETTNATAWSPSVGCGTPTTTASLTAGCFRKISSSSVGDICGIV